MIARAKIPPVPRFAAAEHRRRKPSIWPRRRCWLARIGVSASSLIDERQAGCSRRSGRFRGPGEAKGNEIFWAQFGMGRKTALEAYYQAPPGQPPRPLAGASRSVERCHRADREKTQGRGVKSAQRAISGVKPPVVNGWACRGTEKPAARIMLFRRPRLIRVACPGFSDSGLDPGRPHSSPWIFSRPTGRSGDAFTTNRLVRSRPPRMATPVRGGVARQTLETKRPLVEPWRRS